MARVIVYMGGKRAWNKLQKLARSKMLETINTKINPIIYKPTFFFSVKFAIFGVFKFTYNFEGFVIGNLLIMLQNTPNNTA